MLHYSDEARSLDLELSSLTLNVEVNYAKLMVAVEGGKCKAEILNRIHVSPLQKISTAKSMFHSSPTNAWLHRPRMEGN